ncbi:MAG: NAD(P)/FAD-dependent oxidoreductase [Myxococcota bacterium]
MRKTDVIVIGGGHNALVAAIFLARAGLSVRLLEQKKALGGATRTEQPFEKAPNLKQSTGAYLLGLMPPELIQKLGATLPVIRRDPHYFLPTVGDRYLLFGSDRAATKRQFERFFSAEDWAADERLQSELAMLRADVGPTWLEEPYTIEETAERYVRPELRQVFVALCRGSVGDYLDRFGFKSDLVKAMYAVTDGFSGVNGTWSTPGTGMNFLVHNMCRLPDADGTWMIVRGGMGAIAQELGRLARAARVHIETDAPVEHIEYASGSVSGVALSDGSIRKAKVVVSGADPFQLMKLAGPERLGSLTQKIEGFQRDGTTLKLNMCLKELPRFRCLPGDHGQHQATIHLLPQEREVLASLESSYADVQAGRLPEFPTIEWYIHTSVDRTLQDEEGRHSAALFVQWVPYELAESTWEAEETRYADHLLSIADRFAPGTSDLVIDTFVLTPPKIESHFGISRGHIHHVDNCFGFSDRMPYATPVEGLYACSAGCHPAGSVIGAAGHNAAIKILRDLGAKPT